MTLTHFNDKGRAHMVEVGHKDATQRIAVAIGRVRMAEETLHLIQNKALAKGDVLAVAQVAGIMAAKKTWEMIPMCHPLMLTGIDLSFDWQEDGISIQATVKTLGQTGVEMEALQAVTSAALTIYDMCKAVDKSMVIDQVMLVEKRGGKSGDYVREMQDKEGES